MDKDKAIAKAVAGSIRKVLGKKARFAIMSGGTDMRYLIKRGIPSVGYSARGGLKWHSENEYVHVGSILNTAKIYALTIMTL